MRSVVNQGHLLVEVARDKSDIESATDSYKWGFRLGEGSGVVQRRLVLKCKAVDERRKKEGRNLEGAGCGDRLAGRILS